MSEPLDTEATAARKACGTISTAGYLITLVAEVPRLREREAKLRELHKPHSIYDECDHNHTEKDEASGVFEIDGIGLTCAKLYDVCLACCDVADDGSPSETCTCEHNHGPNMPICKTREILDA